MENAFSQAMLTLICVSVQTGHNVKQYKTNEGCTYNITCKLSNWLSLELLQIWYISQNNPDILHTCATGFEQTYDISTMK